MPAPELREVRGGTATVLSVDRSFWSFQLYLHECHPCFLCLLQTAVNSDLQPAKAPVTSDHPGLHGQDCVTSVLAACQRQLESELFLMKSEMHLRTDDRGKVPGRMKVLGPTACGAEQAETRVP